LKENVYIALSQEYDSEHSVSLNAMNKARATDKPVTVNKPVVVDAIKSPSNRNNSVADAGVSNAAAVFGVDSERSTEWISLDSEEGKQPTHHP
jgi:hypothetical protein